MVSVRYPFPAVLIFSDQRGDDSGFFCLISVLVASCCQVRFSRGYGECGGEECQLLCSRDFA